MIDTPEATRAENRPDSAIEPVETSANRSLHPAAWLTWLVAVLIILAGTRNPYYLGMTLVFIALVRFTHRPARDVESGMPTVEISVWRFGLVVVVLSALINALMVHVGDHVLFTIPARVPLLGGPVTLEAIAFGLLNGLLLPGLFAAFSVVNRVIPMRAALRLAPRAYYPLAVVTSIAVTFVSTTLREIQQIREAQAVRGHRMRGARSWLPVVVPLLEGAMERSLQLAEAMTARGFASAKGNVDARPQLLMLLGLLGLISGWLLRLVWHQSVVGTLLLLVSVITVIAGFFLGGRQHPHTVYRPDRWHGRDWVIVGGALVAAAAVLPWPELDRTSLFYYPYPTLAWPTFNPAIGTALLGLLAPAIV